MDGPTHMASTTWTHSVSHPPDLIVKRANVRYPFHRRTITKHQPCAWEDSCGPPTLAPSAASGDTSAIYERIPGHILSRMRQLLVQSYAVLSVPSHVPMGLAAHGQRRPYQLRDNTYCQWTKHTLPSHRVPLPEALTSIEQLNASTPRLEKILLLFSDGEQAVFLRSKLDDPATLRCVELYHASENFLTATHNTQAFSLPHRLREPNFLTNDRGHLLHRASPISTFAPSALYKGGEIPGPTAGEVGFDFTPVSRFQYTVWPNQHLKGIRSDLGNTSCGALTYLPRPPRAVTARKATTTAAATLTPRPDACPVHGVATGEQPSQPQERARKLQPPKVPAQAAPLAPLPHQSSAVRPNHNRHP